MRRVTPISAYQFAVFRIVLGLYLVLHFAALLPYGPELFGDAGLLPDPGLNVTSGLLPNPLETWSGPGAVTAVLTTMLVLSVSLTLGIFRRTTCLLLWYGWACLFNRNNLISNPSIPYVGMLFLLMTLVPPGEPLRVGRGHDPRRWAFPAVVMFTAWTLLAVGYTFSGLDKLLTSPSWQDGTALAHLADNPLSRPGVLRDGLLALPAWVHAGLTWGALATEVLFLPLCLFRRTRLIAWAAMTLLHLGILGVVDFADLTFGMLVFHLFVLDPAWLPPRPAPRGTSVVFFDGVCGLCHRTVRLLLDEDRAGVLRYAPLQGTTFAALQSQVALAEGLDSLVYARGFGTGEPRVFVRSTAVLQALRDMGGFWRIVSWLRIVPRPVRDAVYDAIAHRRYRLFGRYETCRMPTDDERTRVME